MFSAFLEAPGMHREPDSATMTNRAHWDEMFRTYSAGPHFPVDDVIAGKLSISELEIREIGDIRGLAGVHLQAGMGLDTISLSRLGARMTGVDISPRACEIATRLADRCGARVSFVQADVMDVMDLAGLPVGAFDFVYTSHGVLRWLPNLDRWAANVFALLRPGGWLYMFEIHPLVYRIAAVDGDQFSLTGDYFDECVREKTVDTTHLGSARELRNRTVVHANWTLASIMRSLIDANLRISAFDEHDCTSYSRKGIFSVGDDGLWRPPRPTPVPLAFSLRAIRE
jgi:SAM-dependent methyltransferase